MYILEFRSCVVSATVFVLCFFLWVGYWYVFTISHQTLILSVGFPSFWIFSHSHSLSLICFNGFKWCKQHDTCSPTSMMINLTYNFPKGKTIRHTFALFIHIVIGDGDGGSGAVAFDVTVMLKNARRYIYSIHNTFTVHKKVNVHPLLYIAYKTQIHGTNMEPSSQQHPQTSCIMY